MTYKIGVRHEDKYESERRTSVTPMHVKELIKKGIEVDIIKSNTRIFNNAEYKEAGANLVDNLSENNVIFGVKEIPISFFEENKTYMFFSHVIKGQSYNMPMLKHMMNLKCSLIDYEKVEDENGRRIIFFGHFAGLAGMINSLWSLGQRLKEQGLENPFSCLKQSYKYNSLEEAKKDIAAIGEKIKEIGLPNEICPLTTAFTGDGNVSKGAQEIYDLLPTKEITTDELTKLEKSGNFSNKIAYKIIFTEEFLSERKDGTEFNLQDYYANPSLYQDVFHKYIPNLSMIMNCMYWDKNYPRIITKDYLSELYAKGEPKLKIIGDITCDPNGSIEATHKGTEIEDPVFVYNPKDRKPYMGFKGKGLLIMSVDILPSELPKEASIAFGDALIPFIESIAKADYSVNFNELSLGREIKDAMILHKGELTPKYKYIEEFIK